MKILQLISGLSAGGAEHFVLALCTHAQSDPQSRMDVLTMSAVDEISHKFKEAGINIVAAPSQQKKGVKAFQSLRLLIRQPHDVFHAHMFHACIIACVAKIFRPQVKLVFTLHNNHVPQWHRQLLLFITRPLRDTDIIFPGLRRRWFQKKNAAIIPTGINFQRFAVAHRKPATFTFLFAGRLEPEKNPLFLIPFAQALRNKYEFQIKVAGNGSLKRQLEERIEKGNLQPYFAVHGYVHDMAEFLSQGHCLLLPSLWEGMPMILLEAAASSVPIIATPTGNIPELVSGREGSVGTVEEFEKLAEVVINNYSDAMRKAGAFREKVKKMYSIETVYILHRQLYSH